MPLGGVFRVNTYTTGDQRLPAVGWRPAGPFVVAWSSAQIPASTHDVFAQRYCVNGDADGDGTVGVLDVFYLINYLFAAGPPPLGCADANGSASIDVTDVFYLINFLFASGSPPV